MSTETKATTLFSLQAVKDYLGVVADTNKDEELVLLADAVSERIEHTTRRFFVTRAVVELYDGDGSALVTLRSYPATGVTSVTYTTTAGGSVTTLGSTAFVVNLRLGVVSFRTGLFPAGFQNVSVSYTVGFGAQDSVTLPRDIYQAGLDYLKLVWDEKSSGAIAASSVTLGNGTMVLKPGLPSGIRAVLESWHEAVYA